MNVLSILTKLARFGPIKRSRLNSNDKLAEVRPPALPSTPHPSAVKRRQRGYHGRSEVPQQQHTKPIESFDFRTGRTIKEFPSINSVIRDGYNYSALTRVLRGRSRRYKGVGWRYLGQPAATLHRKPIKGELAGIVEGFDRTTGQVRYTFQHINDASKEGFNPAAISNVLFGVYHSHKGLGWRVQRQAIRGCDPKTGRCVFVFTTQEEARSYGFNSVRIKESIKRGGTHRRLRWSYAPIIK